MDITTHNLEGVQPRDEQQRWMNTATFQSPLLRAHIRASPSRRCEMFQLWELDIVTIPPSSTSVLPGKSTISMVILMENPLLIPFFRFNH